MSRLNPDDFTNEERDKIIKEKTGYSLEQIKDLPILEQQLLLSGLFGNMESKLDEIKEVFINRVYDTVDLIDVPNELKKLMKTALKDMFDNFCELHKLSCAAEAQFELLNDHISKKKEE